MIDQLPTATVKKENKTIPPTKRVRLKSILEPTKPETVFGIVESRKRNKGELWGIKKAAWKKIAIVAISLYIGWSWAKISDQAQIIRLQQSVLAADSSTAVNPK